MKISLPASCNYLCITADHLLTSLPVLFSMTHIISSSNAFLNLCSKCSCIFLLGMKECGQVNSLWPKGFRHQWTRSCSVFIPFCLEILAPQALPSREIKFDLFITHQRTAWGGRYSVTEAQRVGINHWAEGTGFSVANYHFIGLREEHKTTFDCSLHLWVRDNCISSTGNWAVGKSSWNVLKYRGMSDSFRERGAALFWEMEWEFMSLHRACQSFHWI